MTKFGEYLNSRSVNRAEVSRKTGIRTARLFQLSSNPKTNIKGEEVYLISKAIKVDAGEMLEVLFGRKK